jgi:hypothetical protein
VVCRSTVSPPKEVFMASGRTPLPRESLSCALGSSVRFEARIANRKVDLSRITADFKSEESELNLVVRPVDQLKRGWGVNPERVRLFCD